MRATATVSVIDVRAHPLRRIVYLFLAAVMVWQTPVAGVAHAGMVTTETLLRATRSLPTAAVSVERDRLLRFLRRKGVRAELMALGVDPSEAAARVQSLSDAEVASLAARIDSLPAGAGRCDGVDGATACSAYTLLLISLIILAVLLVLGVIWIAKSMASDSPVGDEPKSLSPPTEAASPTVSKSGTTASATAHAGW